MIDKAHLERLLADMRMISPELAHADGSEG